MNLADIFASVRLNLETGKFETDALKSATLVSGKMEKVLKTAVGGAIGAGAGMAFASMTRGALELDAATAQLQADTGMTAEAAKAASKALSGMFKTNLQSFAEIGAAMAAVRTDLGLTGDAADQTAEAFLKYATATGQIAVDAVVAFDDVLDAWGLTAEDAAGIMDQLVAGHQKYGGSIAENQRALAVLAPQLRALNVDTTDAIALLNLFAASGMDSSKATFALNTAVKNLKPGQNLDDLIARISAIEDPTLRAQEAIKVFGARGGVALANTLRPGITGLGDFAIKAEDVTTATEDAASAIENSLGNRAKIALKQFSGTLAEVGTSMGDLLMVAALLGPSLTTKLFAAIGGLAGILATGLGGVWTKVAGSSVVARAVALAGSKAATIYLAALIAGDKIGAALAGAWAKVQTTSAPAIKSLGTFMGTTLGKAVSVAFAAVLVYEAYETYNRVRDELAAQSAALIGQAKAYAAIATAEQRAESLRIAYQARADIIRNRALISGIPGIGPIVVRSTDEALANLQSTIDALERGAAPVIANGMQHLGETGGAALAEGMVTGAATSIPHFRARIDPEMDRAAYGIRMRARAAGNRAMAEIAAGIIESRSKPADAFDTLTEMLEHPLTRFAEKTRLLGQLASKELAAGLASNDPAIRAHAQATKQTIIDRLTELKTGSGKLSREQAKLVAQGLKSKDEDIRRAAWNIYKMSKTPLQTLATESKGLGAAVSYNYAAGLKSTPALLAIEAAAERAANAAKKYLRVSSPAEAGPLSLGGGPEGWGARFGQLYARGMVAGMSSIGSVLGGITYAGAPATATAGASATSYSGGGGSLTINVSTPVLTPGGAEALAQFIAPSVTRWQQDRRLLGAR